MRYISIAILICGTIAAHGWNSTTPPSADGNLPGVEATPWRAHVAESNTAHGGIVTLSQYLYGTSTLWGAINNLPGGTNDTAILGVLAVSGRVDGISVPATNLFIGASDPRMTDARQPLAHTQDVSTVTGAATSGQISSATNAVSQDVLGKMPTTNGLESVASAINRTNALRGDIVGLIPSVSGLVSNGAVTIAAGANVTVNGGASALLTNGATVTIASTGGGGGDTNGLASTAYVDAATNTYNLDILSRNYVNSNGIVRGLKDIISGGTIDVTADGILPFVWGVAEIPIVIFEGAKIEKWIDLSAITNWIGMPDPNALSQQIQSNKIAGVSHDFLQDIRLALIDNRDLYNCDAGPVVTFATSLAGINTAESSNYFYSASGKYCANYVTNGNALRFDGTNDAVVFGGDMGNFTNNFTVSLWVRLYNNATSQRIIGRGSTGDGGQSQWLIHWSSNDRLYFGTNSSGGAYVASSGLTDTNWHHLAWTCGNISTDQVMYIDGVRKVVGGTTTPVELATTTTAPCVIGVGQFGVTNYSPLKAFVDELHILRRGIASNEVASMLNGGLGEYQSTNADTHALFHFDEATGSNTYDASINGYVGKLTNGVVWAAGERANRNENVQMRLTLTNYYAQSQADSGFAMVAVEPIQSINSAADINLYVSRDGGTSSNKVTMTRDAKWDSGTRGIFVGAFDMSAQPAGTNIVLRYITSTNRMNTYGLGVQLK